MQHPADRTNHRTAAGQPSEVAADDSIDFGFQTVERGAQVWCGRCVCVAGATCYDVKYNGVGGGVGRL